MLNKFCAKLLNDYDKIICTADVSSISAIWRFRFAYVACSTLDTFVI